MVDCLSSCGFVPVARISNEAGGLYCGILSISYQGRHVFGIAEGLALVESSQFISAVQVMLIVHYRQLKSTYQSLLSCSPLSLLCCFSVLDSDETHVTVTPLVQGESRLGQAEELVPLLCQ